MDGMTEEQFKELQVRVLGLDEASAISLLKEQGFRVRVRSRDGSSFMGTCDFRQDRMNLEITNGKVANLMIG